MIWCRHERYKVLFRGRTKFQAYCKDCYVYGEVKYTRQKAIISLREEPQWFL